MKKLLKLMFVIAAGAMVGCTNDATEDLVTAPDFVGGGSVKTLSVTLDGYTRVELGERTADAKYPVYWSEGDVLRVNEGTTSSITIGENRSTATFEYSVADAEAYSIVYPYVEGITASKAAYLPVQFAAVQNYTEGTFDVASFPMYGYATSLEEPVSLGYLAGVLMIELKGAGEKLTKVELSVSEGAIAGTFDVNCANGAFAAHDDALQTLTYQLPEGGVALSENATTLYIAVPAGDYNTMKAKFCTDNADVAMIAAIPCTGEKAIKAGVVREFKNITFADNASNYTGDVFEIYDEATLQRFAELCTAGLFEYGSASVTASFEVSSAFAEAWTPIENFAATLEGNDNTISGMTQPLFGTTTGTIQNLNLKSNIVVKTRFCGAFAQRMLPGEDYVPQIIGCSLVEGSSIEYAYTGQDGAIEAGAEDTSTGGFVGYSQSIVVKECENHADLTITAIPTDVAFTIDLAGFVGHATINTSLGIEGTGFTNCTNSGNITMGSGTFTNESLSLNVAGIAGRWVGHASSGCENSGSLIFDSTFTLKYLYAAGIFANLPDVNDSFPYHTVSDCHNLQAGEIKLGAQGSVVRFEAGGIAGNCTNDGYTTIENCTNSAKIGFYGSTHGTSYGRIMVGGIAGLGCANYSNCVNNATGEIYVTGTANNIADNVSVTVGGCVGVNNKGTSIKYVATGLVNHAPVTLYKLVNPDGDSLELGGVFGYSNITKEGSYITNCVNNGAVTFVNASSNYCRIGGLIGYCKTPLLDTDGKNTNNGDVHVTHTAGSMAAAGIVGRYGDSALGPFRGALNTGDVTLYVPADGSMATATVAGIAASCEVEMSDFENRGAVLFEGENAETSKVNIVNVAGAIGSTSAPINNIKNSGTVTVRNLMQKAGTDYHVNVAGVAAVSTHTANLANLENTATGTITVEGVTVDDNIYAGGVVGRDNKESKVISGYSYSNIKNAAALNIKPIAATVTFVGGLCGRTHNALTGDETTYCSNSGAVTVETTNCTAQLYVGGAMGCASSTNAYVRNTGAVTISGNTGSSLSLGGVIGILAGGNSATDKETIFLSHLYNDGPITNSLHVSEQTMVDGVVATPVGNAHIGGILGHGPGNTQYCENGANGDIVHTGRSKATYVGGIFGYNAAKANGPLTGHNTNRGDITSEPQYATSHFIGGIAAYLNSKSSDDTNYGNVTAGGTATLQVHLAGGIGRCVSNNKFRIKNYGNVTFSGSTETYIDMGGCFAYTSTMSSSILHDCENHGDIVVTSTASIKLDASIGGVTGLASGGNIGQTNYGKVSFEGTCEGNLFLGGVSGMAITQSATTAAACHSHKNDGLVQLRARKVVGKAFVGPITGITDAANQPEAGPHVLGSNNANNVSSNNVGEIFSAYDETDWYHGIFDATGEQIVEAAAMLAALA